MSYLDKRGITRDTAENFRLGYDADRNRLVIPYNSPAGFWHLKLRCMADHNCKDTTHSKYIYSEPGVDHQLFNAEVLIDADRVVVVEGELDVIVATQLGLSAVGIPGVEAWTKRRKTWRWCFDSAEEVVVVADGDEPGRRCAAAVADTLRRSLSGEVRVVEMPGDTGMDTSSFVAEYGELEYLNELELL